MSEHKVFGDHKYLAIRNWEKYQATRSGQPSAWIKDYCDKDADPEYSQLSPTQRYLFDGCRRLRGRFGRNLVNDPSWITRSLAVDPSLRGCCAVAIQSLISRGLLIPTNEQVSVPETPLEEKSKEKKSRKSYIEPQGEASPVPEQEKPTPAHSDAQALCDLLSSYSGTIVKPDWLKYASAILEGTSLDKLKALLEWMYVDDDFWGKCTHTTKNLWDHLQAGNLLAKYNAVRKLKKKQIAKAKDEITAPGAHGHDSGLEF